MNRLSLAVARDIRSIKETFSKTSNEEERYVSLLLRQYSKGIIEGFAREVQRKFVSTPSNQAKEDKIKILRCFLRLIVSDNMSKKNEKEPEEDFMIIYDLSIILNRIENELENIYNSAYANSVADCNTPLCDFFQFFSTYVDAIMKARLSLEELDSLKDVSIKDLHIEYLYHNRTIFEVGVFNTHLLSLIEELQISLKDMEKAEREEIIEKIHTSNRLFLDYLEHSTHINTIGRYTPSKENYTGPNKTDIFFRESLRRLRLYAASVELLQEKFSKHPDLQKFKLIVPEKHPSLISTHTSVLKYLKIIHIPFYMLLEVAGVFLISSWISTFFWNCMLLQKGLSFFSPFSFLYLLLSIFLYSFIFYVSKLEVDPNDISKKKANPKIVFKVVDLSLFCIISVGFGVFSSYHEYSNENLEKVREEGLRLLLLSTLFLQRVFSIIIRTVMISHISRKQDGRSSSLQNSFLKTWSTPSVFYAICLFVGLSFLFFVMYLGSLSRLQGLLKESQRIN